MCWDRVPYFAYAVMKIREFHCTQFSRDKLPLSGTVVHPTKAPPGSEIRFYSKLPSCNLGDSLAASFNPDHIKAGQTYFDISPGMGVSLYPQEIFIFRPSDRVRQNFGNCAASWGQIVRRERPIVQQKWLIVRHNYLLHQFYPFPAGSKIKTPTFSSRTLCNIWKEEI